MPIDVVEKVYGCRGGRASLSELSLPRKDARRSMARLQWIYKQQRISLHVYSMRFAILTSHFCGEM